MKPAPIAACNAKSRLSVSLLQDGLFGECIGAGKFRMFDPEKGQDGQECKEHNQSHDNP